MPRGVSAGGSYLRRDTLRGLDADAGVPLTRRQHGDLVQELVDARQQVGPVLRFVGDVVEDLQRKRASLKVTSGMSWSKSCHRLLTSSVIRVAMDRPISWYWGPFPKGPSSRKRNLSRGRSNSQVLDWLLMTFDPRVLDEDIQRTFRHRLFTWLAPGPR